MALPLQKFLTSKVPLMVGLSACLCKEFSLLLLIRSAQLCEEFTAQQLEVISEIYLLTSAYQECSAHLYEEVQLSSVRSDTIFQLNQTWMPTCNRYQTTFRILILPNTKNFSHHALKS